MFKKILILLLNTIEIYSQNCNIAAGFTWCQSANKCVRELYEPCLPITKECAYCILSHYGDDISCGNGCSVELIEDMVNNGFQGTDENGCSSGLNAIWCNNLNQCIDINEVCPSIQNDPNQCINYQCPITCSMGYKNDKNGCNTCTCNEIHDNNNICPLPPQDCNNEQVCPMVTEITHCSNGGINGYTTYQLSLIINKERKIKNIYALFGDSQDIPNGNALTVPPAYQSPSSIFNSNFGGVDPQLLSINILSEYDSWLTIGIIDGDPNNKLSSIGIDFSSWTSDTGLEVTNGAIFILDPREPIVDGNEYIIARLTIPTDDHQIATFNVQGEQEGNGHNILDPDRTNIWMQRNIIFNLQKGLIGH